MKVKLLFNIPADEAKRLGLERTRAFQVVDVSEAVGRELLDRLWAREATDQEAREASQ